MGWTGWMSLQRDSQESSPKLQFKSIILWCSAFFTIQLSHPYMTTGKTIALTRWTFVGQVMSAFLQDTKSDTGQSQLAKCPDDPQCSEVNQAHTRGLTWPWSFQKHLFSPPGKSISWQPVLSRGRNREDPGRKRFLQLLECPPKPASWG